MSEQENTAEFLDESAGDSGFEEMGINEQTIPLLLICQSNSADAVEAGIKPGEFYNSLTKKSYGVSLDMVVSYFKIAWVEWLPNGGGLAGRYEPNSIEVTGNAYDGYINPKTQNIIQETWMYYVLLPEHMEDGFLLFNSTRGCMKYFKNWNTQMKFLRLPSGKPAQIYSSIWRLTTGRDQNKKGQKYFSLRSEDGKAGIQRVGWITKELMDNHVKPIREIAPKARLQLVSFAQDTAETVSAEY